MALPKIEDARALSNEELHEEIASVKKQLFDLRFQMATRQLETTHEFKHRKHQLAQLMTVESERAIATKLSDESGSVGQSDVDSSSNDQQDDGGEK